VGLVQLGIPPINALLSSLFTYCLLAFKRKDLNALRRQPFSR
jgi:hypothetical protein